MFGSYRYEVSTTIPNTASPFIAGYADFGLHICVLGFVEECNTHS